MNKDNDDILHSARAEIDAIDDEIHQLLIKRESAVDKVLQAKGGAGTGGNPVRFEREAQILRRLYENHVKSGSRLSFLAVVRIWHELIAAYTLLQNPYEISVDSVDMTLVRQQFGDSVPVREAEFAANKHKAEMWVLPHPKAGDWWLNLGERNILACLPFVHEAEAGSAPLAYVVGDCGVALSSADGSQDVLCLQITSDGSVALDDLVELLAAEDICFIVASGTELYCERHAKLPHDIAEQLKLWQKIEGVGAIKRLGTYAKPLELFDI